MAIVYVFKRMREIVRVCLCMYMKYLLHLVKRNEPKLHLGILMSFTRVIWKCEAHTIQKMTFRAFHSLCGA